MIVFNLHMKRVDTFLNILLDCLVDLGVARISAEGLGLGFQVRQSVISLPGTR